MHECPFCMSQLKPGATVCTGCGASAHKGYVSKEKMGFMIFSGLIFSLVLSFLIALYSQLSFINTFIFMMIVFCLGVPAIIKYKNKDKITFLRRI